MMEHTIELTKYGHACVKLTKRGKVLIIDPGMLTPPPDLLDEANAILITHEHFDHFDDERVLYTAKRDPRLTIYTCAAVADRLSAVKSQVQIVKDGDRLAVAGFDVSVIGKEHHVGRSSVPVVENVGFFIDQEVFHPGDALTLYPAPTLLLPTQAGWMTDADMIGYLQQVNPQRVFPIHDGGASDWRSDELETMLREEAERMGTVFMWLEPGDTVILPDGSLSRHLPEPLSDLQGIIDWETRKSRVISKHSTRKTHG